MCNICQIAHKIQFEIVIVYEKSNLKSKRLE